MCVLGGGVWGLRLGDAVRADLMERISFSLKTCPSAFTANVRGLCGSWGNVRRSMLFLFGCDSLRSHSGCIPYCLGRTFHSPVLVRSSWVGLQKWHSSAPDSAESYPNFPGGRSQSRRVITCRKTWKSGEVIQRAAPKLRGRARPCWNLLLLFKQGVSQQNQTSTRCILERRWILCEQSLWLVFLSPN